jgi:glycosyltransferase involved in cell wall biosynthesis
VVSFRLGGTDGVAVEAAKWAWALGVLGFAVRRVAGEIADPGPDDVVLPWLRIESRDEGMNRAGLARALDGADLVVVENTCSLPLNPGAALATRDAVAQHSGRVAFHHHDLPWQRDATYIGGFPPLVPGALHVAINHRSRRELADRGVIAHTVPNMFDFDSTPRGDRDATRECFELGADELVVLQPTRAIPRKNVAGGVAYAAALDALLPERGVCYWLTGPAEDGYGPALECVLATSPVPVRRGSTERPPDAYAAADVVVFPSTWEGFGNPVIESVIARRPLAVAAYLVLDELLDAGLELFPLDRPERMAAWLRQPNDRLLNANRERARRRFSLTDLPARLDDTFRRHGWTSW